MLPARNKVQRKRTRKKDAFELNLIRELEKIRTSGMIKARGNRMKLDTLTTSKLTSSLVSKFAPSGFIKILSKRRIRSSLQ